MAGMNRLLLALLPLALAACAAAPAQKEVALASIDKDTICEHEARTGSNLPTKRCRSAEQRQADQEALSRVEEQRRNITGLTTGK